MHFCAFWQLSKFNARCSVNLMFAKSLFSEICTQKAHFAQLGPSWGASAGPEGAADRVRRSASRCQSRIGFESRRGIPYLKVELGLHYALLFHDSGIYPVFLLIQHVLLLRARVLQPKSDRVQGFADDKVERVQSRIGLKVG